MSILSVRSPPFALPSARRASVAARALLDTSRIPPRVKLRHPFHSVVRYSHEAEECSRHCQRPSGCRDCEGSTASELRFMMQVVDGAAPSFVGSRANLVRLYVTLGIRPKDPPSCSRADFRIDFARRARSDVVRQRGNLPAIHRAHGSAHLPLTTSTDMRQRVLWRT